MAKRLSKLVQKEIQLCLPSTLDDIGCNDGEVASFKNVDWLSAIANSGSAANGSNNGNTSSSQGNNGNSVTAYTLRLTQEPIGITFPYGATLLAVHTPESLHREKIYILHTANDSLATYSTTGGLKYLPGVVSKTLGIIRKAIPFGNVITLIGEKVLGYVIFDETEKKYQFTTTAPTAPTVEFAVEPAHVEGYTRMAGAMPQLNVTIDLPLSVCESQTALGNWLNAGLATAVSEEVKERVYRGVGKAVETYVGDMANLGYLLTPATAIATLDDILPTQPVLLETSYRPPYCLLQSWNYNAEKLTLELYFSLRPYKITLRHDATERNNIWKSLFTSLQIHVSKQAEWRKSGNTYSASVLNNLSDADTGERLGRAFRFSALSAEQLNANLSIDETPVFHTVDRALPITSSGYATIRASNGKGTLFKPCYDDAVDIKPCNGEKTDDGIILWGGEFIRRNIKGEEKTISLENGIIASLPNYPPVFRHYCHIGEGKTCGVIQGNGSRNVTDGSRHPLYAISTDGIRLLSTDGAGGYLNSRLISRRGCNENTLTALSARQLYYTAAEELWHVGNDGSVGRITEIESTEGYEEMAVMQDTDSLLLRKNASVELISVEDGNEYAITDIVVGRLCEWEGNIYTTRTDGTLNILHSEKLPIAQQMPDEKYGEEYGEEGDERQEGESERVKELQKTSQYDSTITTRPMKLGSPFARKHIRQIIPLSSKISISLEGSDDCKEWERVASFVGSRYGIRSRGYRFWRIIMQSKAEDTEWMRKVALGVRC